jgi:hypothetical protein
VKTFYRVTLYTTLIPIDDEMGFMEYDSVTRAVIGKVEAMVRPKRTIVKNEDSQIQERYFDHEPDARRFADSMEPGYPHDQYKESA